MEAVSRLRTAAPALTGVCVARDIIPELADRVLLHAGPPTTLDALCGPMRGAVHGALIYEGWARSPDESETLLKTGAIRLRCSHDFGVVGPMAGVISASMPLFEVRDPAHGTVSYAPINEGVGVALRFGAYDETVINRLRWIETVLAPALHRALHHLDAVRLVPLIGRALTMGDELHQRNIGATGLLFRILAPALVVDSLPAATLASIFGFLAENDQFFLNLAMAAAKATLESVRAIPYSTIVTAMSRNGVEFGIRISGLGDQWFTAPAPVPSGLFFPGFTADDANPDMGDSAIVETLGLGGFAMAAAPAVAGFLGLNSVEEATTMTRTMGEITLSQSPHFRIPALGGDGVPQAIDLRRVVNLEITPVINTGIAHRRAGVGQIGAGVARAPLRAFQDALRAFASRYADRAQSGR